MKTVLSTALVLAGSLGVASAAMAATPVVHHRAPPVERVQAVPVKIMSEKTNPNPGLDGVFQASDAPLALPSVNDPRIHGLPNF